METVTIGKSTSGKSSTGSLVYVNAPDMSIRNTANTVTERRRKARLVMNAIKAASAVIVVYILLYFDYTQTSPLCVVHCEQAQCRRRHESITRHTSLSARGVNRVAGSSQYSI